MEMEKGYGLATRDIVSLLLSDARSKPAIADLVERIDELTYEELETISVPLPWYRKALIELKKRNAAASINASILTAAKDETGYEVVSFVGDILRYTGFEQEIVPVGSRLTISIKPGDLLFRMGNELWLSTTLISTTGTLKLSTGGEGNINYELVKSATQRSDYSLLVLTNPDHAASATPSPTVSSNGWFTITRN